MSISKINVDGTTHDITPSPNGTLYGVENYDTVPTVQATEFNNFSVIPIDETSTTSFAFNVLTRAMRNIRYLYNKLSDLSYNRAIVNQNTLYLNHTVSQHTHSDINDLPISNVDINSTEYIPTAALLYELNQRIENIGDNLQLGENITTNVVCGGIQQGTTFSSSTSIKDILKLMIKRDFTAYSNTNVDTWNSLADVNAFFTRHTPENGWAGLKLGNYVRINDGTYNLNWGIFGFDCELNRTAATGQSYNNGRGLMMRPINNLLYASSGVAWKTTNSVSGGYASSNLNTVCNSTVYNKLKVVCGTHIIHRRVYLSNAVDSNNRSSSVGTLSRYLVLPTRRQLGIVETRYPPTDYDIGEANYKLPLYIYSGTENGRYQDYFQWTREISTGNTSSTSNLAAIAVTPKDYAYPYEATSYAVTRTSYPYTSSETGSYVTKTFAIGPTMYLR